jgi:hypothetical protein
MTSMAIPLRDLGQRISQQQAELEKLRKEYEARQTKMRELTRRKEQLQGQLRQVEEELQGVDAGRTAARKPASAATSAAKPATTPAKRASLAQVLVDIVSAAGGPMTVKELTQEVEKRKYPTTSTNLSALIKNRVSTLVKKKLLRRAKDKGGVLPVQRAAMPQGPAKAARNDAPTAGIKPAALKKPTSATAVTGAKSDLTLPAVITKVLARSTRPLLARELADKVRESGYQTKSKDFIKNVWAAVGSMATVEHVKGKGYRLKKP